MFSLTLKQKYQTIQSQYAIYSINSYGPTFGGGHDLNIINNANTVRSSYSNHGHSYFNNGQTNGLIAGGSPFLVLEYEVYQL
jgi:hypothetical protein